MSYCRFSSENWDSDVYCYDAREGIVIHVAACRFEADTPIPPVPPVELWNSLAVDDVRLALARRQEWIDAARRVQIGLVYDGETFVEGGPEDAVDRLEELRAMGYRVPQAAIDFLRGEAQSESEPGDAA